MPDSELANIAHIVVLMLENRSFDSMLGYLYTDAGNRSPSGLPYAGLTGDESCPDSAGKAVPVYPITPDTANAYFMPGADPGEGYAATNDQLYGSTGAPPSGAVAPMTGFVVDYAQAIADNQRKGWYVVPGTTADMIMGCYRPETLPVLSALARGYGVCDTWFGSAPTETMPNRAFACAATSQGHMDDVNKSFTVPSIFGALSDHGVDWKIYGYSAMPLTRSDFPDTDAAPASHFGLFKDFQADAAGGGLASYSFLEPSWGPSGNSQHPNYDVALGEQLILETYRALFASPQWDSTLLVVTYDEHGGCYDHVPPPWSAVAPDSTPGEFGFAFDRFGPRVPTVLVSPLIAAGTVLSAPAGSTPYDHTSILATVEARWGLPALTARDAAAPNVAGAPTLTTPRTDDPLVGVTAPPPPPTPAEAAREPAHLQKVQAELVARRHGADPDLSGLTTADDYDRFIREHDRRDRVPSGRSRSAPPIPAIRPEASAPAEVPVGRSTNGQ